MSRWEAMYGDKDLSDVRRLKDLKAEKIRLKKIVSEQAFAIRALRVAQLKKY